jgi:hypothetical protein
MIVIGDLQLADAPSGRCERGVREGDLSPHALAGTGS